MGVLDLDHSLFSRLVLEINENRIYISKVFLYPLCVFSFHTTRYVFFHSLFIFDKESVRSTTLIDCFCSFVGIYTRFLIFSVNFFNFILLLLCSLTFIIVSLSLIFSFRVLLKPQFLTLLFKRSQTPTTG